MQLDWNLARSMLSDFHIAQDIAFSAVALAQPFAALPSGLPATKWDNEYIANDGKCRGKCCGKCGRGKSLPRLMIWTA